MYAVSSRSPRSPRRFGASPPRSGSITQTLGATGLPSSTATASIRWRRRCSRSLSGRSATTSCAGSAWQSATPSAAKAGDVHVEAGQPQSLDPPRAVDQLVCLVVVAVAAHSGVIWPPDGVLQRPDPGRSRRRRDVDLGHVAVVHGDRVAEGSLEELEELVGALDH